MQEATMKWNRRVIKQSKNGEDFYQIHEVFYEGGRVTGWTEQGVGPAGETLDELREEIELFKDALSKPVLEEDPNAPANRPTLRRVP